MKIKRIQAIHILEKRLGKLRVLIPVYKARNPTYEHVLAKQIIDIDLQLIEAKSNNFQTHSPVPHPSAAHTLLPQPFSALKQAPQPPAPHPPQPQPLEINDIVGILTKHPRQISNLYQEPGQPIGAPVNHFCQIKYLPFPNAMPDLDQALSGAKVDCARDLTQPANRVRWSGKSVDDGLS